MALPAFDQLVGKTRFVPYVHRPNMLIAELYKLQGFVLPIGQAVLQRLELFVQGLKPAQPRTAEQAVNADKPLDVLRAVRREQLCCQMPDPSRVHRHTGKGGPNTTRAFGFKPRVAHAPFDPA